MKGWKLGRQRVPRVRESDCYRDDRALFLLEGAGLAGCFPNRGSHLAVRTPSCASTSLNRRMVRHGKRGRVMRFGWRNPGRFAGIGSILEGCYSAQKSGRAGVRQHSGESRPNPARGGALLIILPTRRDTPKTR